MVEDNTVAVESEQVTQPFASTVDILTQLRTEKEAIQKSVEENKKIMKDMLEMRTRDIMGGNSNAGKPNEIKKTPQQIADEEAEATVKRMFGR